LRPIAILNNAVNGLPAGLTGGVLPAEPSLRVKVVDALPNLRQVLLVSNYDSERIVVDGAWVELHTQHVSLVLPFDDSIPDYRDETSVARRDRLDEDWLVEGRLRLQLFNLFESSEPWVKLQRCRH